MHAYTFSAAAALCLLLAAPAAGEERTCEEPDFAFLAGGPNTQGQFVPQLIWANRLGVDHEREDGARVSRRTFDSVGRLEFGLTDELELDLVSAYELRWERRGAEPSEAVDGARDTIVGVRYRVLDQKEHWLTVAIGPQVFLPTGDEDRDLGRGETGYAVDFAASHDWGRVFFYASLNWLWTPDVRDPTPGSHRRFDFNDVVYAFALAGKAVEHWEGEVLHDVHVFLEFAGALDDEVSSSAAAPPGVGRRKNIESFVLAPGVRYGLKTPGDRLFEIGVSVPFGLDRDPDDWGIIVQLQYEHPF